MQHEHMDSGRSLAGADESHKKAATRPVFRALPLLRSPHMQTIVAMMWPQRGEWFSSTHHLIELADGDKLAVVVSTPTDWRPGRRTVVLVHGLCGCHGSPYMVRLAGKLFVRGLRAVRVNHRGCGSGVGLARRPYHSGRSDDVRAVVQWLAREEPRSPITLAGFSLGGNLVLKLAGEDGDAPTPGLDSVIAVSAPIDLDACATLIGQPRNRMYDSYFVRRLVADANERQRFFPDLPPLGFPQRLTVRIFDDLYTAPRSGFRDANDYYARCSAAPIVSHVGVPTLVMTARDDPFIAVAPFEALPPRPNVELHITEHGGHLGFLGFTGRAWSFRWMDDVLLEWIGRFSP